MHFKQNTIKQNNANIIETIKRKKQEKTIKKGKQINISPLLCNSGEKEKKVE